MWAATVLMAVSSLVWRVPCGLPLALGCRASGAWGYRRGAWWAGVGWRAYGGGVGARGACSVRWRSPLCGDIQPSGVGLLVGGLAHHG